MARSRTCSCAASRKATSIYFIGEVGIIGNEILVFDINATPADQAGPFTVQFKREFFTD